MITKLVTTDSYDFGQPSTQLVPQLNSGKVDSTWLKKQAGVQGMFEKEIAELTKTAGKSVLHVIALGDEEAYLSNRNGDAFSEADTKTAHTQFKDQGHVFANHCFPPGTSVTLADGSLRDICQISLGDTVRTHLGSSVVSSVYVNNFTGSLVKLTLRGTTVPLAGTPNHPVLCYRRSQVNCSHKYSRLAVSPGHAYRCREIRLPIGDPAWIALSDIQVGDYLVERIVTLTERDGDVRRAAFVGWVASEGYVEPAGNCIRFTFARHNQLDIQAVTELAVSLGATVNVYDHVDNNLQHLSVHSAQLKADVREFVNGTFDKKQLSAKHLSWNKDCLRAFLSAYVDGDGCIINTGVHKGVLRIRSSSPHLLNQVKDIASVLGGEASANIDKAAEQMLSPTNAKYYVGRASGCVYVSPRHIKELIPFSRKLRNSDRVLRSRAGYTSQLGSHLLRAVVAKSEQPHTGNVFNLNVDEHHSYIANSVVVHNCNSDPKKAVGTVLATAHNDPMHRVELLIEVDHKKAPRNYVDNLEAGDDVAVSMGSAQRFDVCSSCGHKAPTAAQHCDCIKNHLMEVLANGQQIYMKNPNPSFFDISLVHRPADRIGHALRKVAYSTGTVGGHELAKQLNLDPLSLVKNAMLIRLADMEKRIPVRAHQIDLKPATVKQLKHACDCMGNSAVLRMLADKGALLSPRDFADVFVRHQDPDGAGQAIESCGSLRDLEDPIEVGSLDPGEKRHIALTDDADQDLHESCGCEPEPFVRRALRITIIRPKLATVTDSHEVLGLAQLYQHYKLAFAVHNFDRACILQNVACLP